MDLHIAGKTALVTGSNKGTGEIIANQLRAEGVIVIGHSQDTNDKNETCMAGDIRTEAGTQAVLDQLAEKNIDVDILINNYGVGEMGSWETSTTEDWIQMYQTNVLGGVRLIQALIPSMENKQWGRIVQLGTVGSTQPNNIMPHYYASKGALATASVSLAKHYAAKGITVNTVSPGLIKTPELEAMFRKRASKKGLSENWEDIEKHITEHDFPNPSGRIARREEVADMVVFLCSPRAAHINGQNIRIDGGAVGVV